MEKLLRLAPTDAPITLQPAAQHPAPRPPPLFVQAEAPRRPGCRGRAGRPGSASGRAAQPWAAHPQQGLSIFRAEEATISRAERPPRLASLAAPPPLPPGTGDSSRGPLHHADPAPQFPALLPRVAGAHRPHRLRRNPRPTWDYPSAMPEEAQAALPHPKPAPGVIFRWAAPRRQPAGTSLSFRCLCVQNNAEANPTLSTFTKGAQLSLPALAPGGRNGTQQPNS